MLPVVTRNTAPASQTSVSTLNLLMLLLLSLTTVAQLLNFLGCCGGGNDKGGSSSSASSRQLSADSRSIRSDVESPPDGYFTMCWPARGSAPVRHVQNAIVEIVVAAARALAFNKYNPSGRLEPPDFKLYRKHVHVASTRPGGLNAFSEQAMRYSEQYGRDCSISDEHLRSYFR